MAVRHDPRISQTPKLYHQNSAHIVGLYASTYGTAE